MKTRGIIGQRIVAVSQERVSESGRGATINVRHIELENGTRIVPVVHEGEADYSVDFIAVKPARAR